MRTDGRTHKGKSKSPLKWGHKKIDSTIKSKFKGGHNSWNSQARVLNPLKHDWGDNKEYMLEVWSRYLQNIVVIENKQHFFHENSKSKNIGARIINLATYGVVDEKKHILKVRSGYIKK
jgi:hypothetical protein